MNKDFFEIYEMCKSIKNKIDEDYDDLYSKIIDACKDIETYKMDYTVQPLKKCIPTLGAYSFFDYKASNVFIPKRTNKVPKRDYIRYHYSVNGNLFKLDTFCIERQTPYDNFYYFFEEKNVLYVIKNDNHFKHLMILYNNDNYKLKINYDNIHTTIEFTFHDNENDMYYYDETIYNRSLEIKYKAFNYFESKSLIWSLKEKEETIRILKKHYKESLDNDFYKNLFLNNLKLYDLSLKTYNHIKENKKEIIAFID